MRHPFEEILSPNGPYIDRPTVVFFGGPQRQTKLAVADGFSPDLHRPTARPWRTPYDGRRWLTPSAWILAHDPG